ncbi:HAD hydrolase family protein [Halocella sp. SP3-1]|uniref:HAD family hydrolase n=1 Tax=Halocella sp. SP3-1 TaxID=2382161 RepID=UPI000F759840|nr:HAD hydrolase family protein [Halocella sp. SP3-1]AZO94730.1 haloacid dehalogenase [Halocella sp. SP3-1]
MLQFDIPGRKKYAISNLVLDYNGTIACDGKVLKQVKEKLAHLSKNLDIYILTADTFGTVRDEFIDSPVNIVIIDDNSTGIEFKKEFIEKIGQEKTIAFGNGANDVEMLKNAELGILVIGVEGSATESLINSNLVINDIIDGLNLLLYPKRLIATLRR